MMKTLFLDDNQRRIDIFRGVCPNADIVSTANEAIEFLKNNHYDIVSLDHDLNGEYHVDSDRDDCGMEVVRWIANNLPEIGKIIIHSHNEVASCKMADTLLKHNYEVARINFGPMFFVFLGLTFLPPSL